MRAAVLLSYPLESNTFYHLMTSRIVQVHSEMQHRVFHLVLSDSIQQAYHLFDYHHHGSLCAYRLYSSCNRQNDSEQNTT